MADAGRRYQRTFEGALNNADRQARYRARQAEAKAEAREVTHHSSTVTAPDATVVLAAAITCQTRPAASEIVCVCCGAASSRELVRLDVLRWRERSASLPPGSPRRPP